MFPSLIELLAPARDLACGIAAISHGADAVYIGADRFGARAAAGNSLGDIRRLCDYAHQFGARVYVTVNTIIYEDELEATQQLVTALSRIGVDALLVQDMATLQMRRVALVEAGRAPVLHASTQCDTRTVEKVSWLRGLGFTRAVLARELSADEVRAIHRAVPDMELEVFVHGALCVSYSGQCYASQHLFGRSANRGECAQVCRMKYDLVDADGKTVVRDRYLMSMKDLCLIDHLEELAGAGATSFKIEGRLKGVEYVKNVVSAYSRRLDDIVRRHPGEYRRASWGRVEYGFRPDLARTFNRGYTGYFVSGRQRGLCTMSTPKALGQFVGTVRSVGRDYIEVGGRVAGQFSNGDGLCFIGGGDGLEGFRVNRADGNRLYPFRMPNGLQPGMSLYRNSDTAFDRQLAGETARRVIPIDMTFSPTAAGFSLTVAFSRQAGVAGGRFTAVATTDFPHQTAQKPQGDNMRRQLSRLGGTPYEAATITLDGGADGLFVPSSLLAAMRRDAVAQLSANVLKHSEQQTPATDREHSGGASQVGGGSAPKAAYWSPEYRRHPYLFNVANHVARAFYARHGIDVAQPAFEVDEPEESVVMQCRYCLRYELGFCVRRGGKQPAWREPLSLRLGDGRSFRLDFRCDECQMNLVSPRRGDNLATP